MRRFIKCGLCLIVAAALTGGGLYCDKAGRVEIIRMFGERAVMEELELWRLRRDAQGRIIEDDEIIDPRVVARSPEGRRHARAAEMYEAASFACFGGAALALLLGLAVLIPRRRAETKAEAPDAEAGALERIHQLLAAIEKGEVKP